MEAETTEGREVGDGASGYYMDSGGMLVVGGMEGGDDYGEEERLSGGGEVHQMRRELSGEAYEWVPQSQSSDEALSQQQPAQAYDHQAYDHQAYAGGLSGGAFGLGAWGSGGATAAATDGGDSGEWGDDAIVLEPAHPFDEWNFGGTVAVHTRVQQSRTGQQFQFLAKCCNIDRWSGWESEELAANAAAAARALMQPGSRADKGRASPDSLEDEHPRHRIGEEKLEATGEARPGSQPIKELGDEFSEASEGVSDVGSAY